MVLPPPFALRYPSLDADTSSAIEVHLCGFDVIDRSVAGILSPRVTRSES